MEHIRLIDVARSVVIWLIVFDVVACSLKAVIGVLQRRTGMVPLALAGLLLAVASVTIWAIALSAPIAWAVLLIVVLAAVQAGAWRAGQASKG